MSIPEIVITSKPDAELFLKENVSVWPIFDSIISIGNPNTNPPTGYKYTPYRLRIEFEDVELESNDYCAPSRYDTDKIIEFAKDVERRGDDRVLIHCDTGLARSFAAGIIVLTVLLGKESYNEAIDMVEYLVSDFDSEPNMLMIELADEALNLEEELINSVESRLRRLPI